MIQFYLEITFWILFFLEIDLLAIWLGLNMWRFQ